MSQRALGILGPSLWPSGLRQAQPCPKHQRHRSSWGCGGERERRQGAPQPDWPSGRPTAMATVHSHHSRRPERGWRGPAGMRGVEGLGRGVGRDVECGPWSVGAGLRQPQDQGLRSPPTNSAVGRARLRAMHTRCTGPVPSVPRATTTGRQRHLRPHGAVPTGPRRRGRAPGPETPCDVRGAWR